MKKGCFKNYFVAASFALVAPAVTWGEDFARWVDPFIGTAGTANCHPNACYPHGMVQAGPTSGTGEWKYCSGYQLEDAELFGFVQDAVSGTGCPDLGDIRIQPFAGEGENARKTAVKADEKASPGFYSVQYPKQGIVTEVAVSPHVAFYRFAFGKGDAARLLVDLQWGHCDKSDVATHVVSCETYFPDATTMTGHLHLKRWVERDCYFAMKFGKPVAARKTVPRKDVREKGEWHELGFDMADGEPLLVKVSLSRTSVAAAERNLAAEVPHWDFARTAKEARDAWNELFSRCEIEGSDDQKTAFYTSMYHLFIAPNDISDMGEKPFYSTLSFWDTFRAAHPLYTILAPERVPGMVDSILEQGKKTGFLPIWCLWGKDNQCMIGTHSVPVIVDWFLKECENVKLWNCGNVELCKCENGDAIDTNRNCHNCSQIANTNVAFATGSLGVLEKPASTKNIQNSKAPSSESNLNPVKKQYWLNAYAQIKETLTKQHAKRHKERWDLIDKYGYYPFDEIKGESVSRTMECAYDDWCAGVMAEKLREQGTGNRERDERLKADAEFFFKRSENWRNVFDASIGLVRGKDSNGKWREPYDPYTLGHGADKANDFTEGNAFQYTWHVMQNPQGLVDAMGGREAFAKKLDSLFEAPSKTEGMGEVLDVTGLIGQYVQGNEPSHHVIYFYPQVGRPEKAAERIREVFDKFYLPKPDGLCGNDDCGQMSAWYVFSALGFYPFNPCGGEYVIGAPQVPKATVKLETKVGVGGIADKFHSPTRTQHSNSFTIIARNLSKENKYVKSVTLNGKPVTDWKIRHSDIMSGGELVFEMGAAIALVSPADGAEVPLLKDKQRAFMRMPREKRAAYFNDKRPDMKKAIKTLRSAPRPVKLEWTGGRGPYKVTVTKRGSDEPWFCETVVSNRVDVWNLEIAATYDWTVCAGGECARGWFRTEDQAPRLVCVPGVPNMRDIGGRVIGGRRVRQGLVYRSSGLNNNATTNAPGTARLTERWRKYMRDRLGIKTDLDLRSTRERFGMTCSPLGPDVNFVTMPTNYHGYAAIHTTGADDTRRVLRVFLDRANYPIDFHCIGGADRTGTVATILHGILGLDEDEIWKDYQITAWHGVVNDTAHLKRFKRLVDSFDRFEGATLSDRIRSYVRCLGFTESDMQTIRDIMFEGSAQEHGARAH